MLIMYIIFFIAAVYLSIGMLFAVPFVTRGVTKIDEGAVGSGWGFRIIIIPGSIVFWPFLLKKWLKALNK